MYTQTWFEQSLHPTSVHITSAERQSWVHVSFAKIMNKQKYMASYDRLSCKAKDSGG